MNPVAPPTIPVTALSNTGFWMTASAGAVLAFTVMSIVLAMYVLGAPMKWVDRLYWMVALVPLGILCVTGYTIGASMTHNQNVIESHYGMTVTAHQSACFTLLAEHHVEKCAIGKIDFTLDDNTVTAYNEWGWPIGQIMGEATTYSKSGRPIK